MSHFLRLDCTLYVTALEAYWCTEASAALLLSFIRESSPSSSSRHTPVYTPSKVLLTEKSAEVALLQHLKATYICRDDAAFCQVSICTWCTNLKTKHQTIVCIQCRDTYWVESFNHQLLTYVPKRIHFSTTTFRMRLNLALMDWVSCLVFNTHIFTLLLLYRMRMSTEHTLAQVR